MEGDQSIAAVTKVMSESETKPKSRRKPSSRPSRSSRDGEERPEKQQRRKKRDDRKKPSSSEKGEGRSRSEKKGSAPKESRREPSRKRRPERSKKHPSSRSSSLNQSCVTETSVAATSVNLNQSCVTETSIATSLNRSKNKSRSLNLLDQSCVTETSVASSFHRSNNNRSGTMSFEIDNPHEQSMALDDATATSHTISNESMTKEQRAWAGISNVLQRNSGDASTVSTSEILPPALIGALRDMKRGAASASSPECSTSKPNSDDSQNEDSSSNQQSLPSLMDASFVTQQTDLQSMVSLLSSANRVVSGTDTEADKKPLVEFCNRMIELASAEPSERPKEKLPIEASQTDKSAMLLIPQDDDECIGSLEEPSQNHEAAQASMTDIEDVLTESHGRSVRFDDSGQKSLGFVGQLLGADAADFRPNYDLNNSLPSIATFEADHAKISKKNASFGDIYSAVALDEDEASCEGDNLGAENKAAFLNYSMTFGQFSTPQLVIPGVDELTVALDEPMETQKRGRTKPRHSDRRPESHERHHRTTTRRRRSKSRRRKEKWPKPPATAPEQFELPSDQFKSFLPKDEHEDAEQVSAIPAKRRFPLFKIPIPKRFGSASTSLAKDYHRRPTASIKTRISTIFMKATTTTRKGSDETLPSRDEACFFPDEEKPANEDDNMLLPF